MPTTSSSLHVLAIKLLLPSSSTSSSDAACLLQTLTAAAAAACQCKRVARDQHDDDAFALISQSTAKVTCARCRLGFKV